MIYAIVFAFGASFGALLATIFMAPPDVLRGWWRAITGRRS